MRAKHALGDRIEPQSPNFTIEDISYDDDSIVNLSGLSPQEEDYK